MGDHTTADDARRYRDPEELELWKQRDPAARIRQFLTGRKLWNDSKQEAAQAKAKELVAAAVKRAEEIAAPDKADFFNAVYADMPADLIRQRDTMQTHSLGQREGPEAPRHQGIEAAEGGIEASRH